MNLGLGSILSHAELLLLYKEDAREKRAAAIGEIQRRRRDSGSVMQQLGRPLRRRRRPPAARRDPGDGARGRRSRDGRPTGGRAPHAAPVAAGGEFRPTRSSRPGDRYRRKPRGRAASPWTPRPPGTDASTLPAAAPSARPRLPPSRHRGGCPRVHDRVSLREEARLLRSERRGQARLPHARPLARRRALARDHCACCRAPTRGRSGTPTGSSARWVDSPLRAAAGGRARDPALPARRLNVGGRLR